MMEEYISKTFNSKRLYEGLMEVLLSALAHNTLFRNFIFKHKKAKK